MPGLRPAEISGGLVGRALHLVGGATHHLPLRCLSFRHTFITPHPRLVALRETPMPDVEACRRRPIHRASARACRGRRGGRGKLQRRAREVYRIGFPSRRGNSGPTATGQVTARLHRSPTGDVGAVEESCDGHPWSAEIVLAPCSALIFSQDRREARHIRQNAVSPAGIRAYHSRMADLFDPIPPSRNPAPRTPGETPLPHRTRARTGRGRLRTGCDRDGSRTSSARTTFSVRESPSSGCWRRGRSAR